MSFPACALGDLVKLRSHRTCARLTPPLDVLRCGEEIALVVVATRVGDDQVFDPVVGMAYPREEVVNIRLSTDRSRAVEGLTLRKVLESTDSLRLGKSALHHFEQAFGGFRIRASSASIACLQLLGRFSHRFECG